MIKFIIRDRDHENYNTKITNEVAGRFPKRTITRVGKVYDINGRQVELFTIKVLAEAIDRTPQIVIRWERSGSFPAPIFVIKGKKQRLYSKEQIINLHRLMLHRYQFRKAVTFDFKAFCRDVKAIFYQPHVVIDEKGALIKENMVSV